ncbi:MAG: archease [Burkholderiales bacterium]|nr:archease [Burkholderiales bacterium]
MEQDSPFPVAWEHFEHKADVGVRGIGATQAQAFEQAALALTAIVAQLDLVEPRQQVHIEAKNNDPELLFVDWLDALIYEMATRKMLFSRFSVVIRADQLKATVWGEPIDVKRHQPSVELKGATLTELKVARQDRGQWIAQCVVDV